MPEGDAEKDHERGLCSDLAVLPFSKLWAAPTL
jgi:hypothetical protein